MQALVSGANRGVGLALVRALLARGDRVIATAREPARANALNALTGEYPGHLHVLPLDVARPASIRELAREVAMVHGQREGGDERTQHIDLLVNNAGVLLAGERFGALDAAALEDSFRINAIGPLLLTEALAGQLADGARVANISSVMGSIARTREFRSPSYCMSKAAQNMATAQLAQALAPRGIVVVALHPGWVQTDMGGEGAAITPEDSASGLLKVMDGLQPSHGGQFLDWSGAALPW